MQHNIASVHELVKYVATLPDELKMVLPLHCPWQQKHGNIFIQVDVIDYCEKHFAPTMNLLGK